MKNFFISYNKADRNWAEWIAWHLEEAGYSIIIQARDFGFGTNPVLNMDWAIEKSERTIAVLSPEYLTSRYTKLEWSAVMAKDPTSEKGILLPVRVRKCEPKGLLLALTYIDLVGLDEASARRVLLNGVNLDAKPLCPPDFPGKSETLDVSSTLQHLIKQRPRFPGDGVGHRRYWPPILWLPWMILFIALMTIVIVYKYSPQSISQPTPTPTEVATLSSPSPSKAPSSSLRSSSIKSPVTSPSPIPSQTKIPVITSLRTGVLKWYEMKGESVEDVKECGEPGCNNKEGTRIAIVIRRDINRVKQESREEFKWNGKEWEYVKTVRTPQ